MIENQTLRVLIADDHELVRTGFRIILQAEEDLMVVAEAADGASAVRLSHQYQPDVVLMDVQMPGMDGLAATRAITAADAVDGPKKPAVLILTTFNSDEYLFEALRAGASGFLLKNTSPEELIEAIHVLGRGDALLAPEITRRVIEQFVGSPDMAGGITALQRAQDATKLAELTDREAEVLVALAGGASNSEIAGAMFLGEATIKTHVSRVLMKLGLRDRTQAVVFAYENGVVTPGR